MDRIMYPKRALSFEPLPKILGRSAFAPLCGVASCCKPATLFGVTITGNLVLPFFSCSETGHDESVRKSVAALLPPLVF